MRCVAGDERRRIALGVDDVQLRPRWAVLFLRKLPRHAQQIGDLRAVRRDDRRVTMRSLATCCGVKTAFWADANNGNPNEIKDVITAMRRFFIVCLGGSVEKVFKNIDYLVNISRRHEPRSVFVHQRTANADEVHEAAAESESNLHGGKRQVERGVSCVRMPRSIDGTS